MCPWDSDTYRFKTSMYVLPFFFSLLCCSFVVGFFECAFCLFKNKRKCQLKFRFQLCYLLWHADGLLDSKYNQLDGSWTNLRSYHSSVLAVLNVVNVLLKNLMLNLCFCHVNCQLWNVGFVFPPILWSSSWPKYFEDISLVDSSLTYVYIRFTKPII